MAGKANAPNWKKIESDYKRGMSRREIVKKHGITMSALNSRISRGGWKDGKEKVARKVREKCEEKIADSQADFLASLSDMQTKAAQALYEKLLANIRNFPDGVGTKTVRETVEVKEVTMEDGIVKKFPLRSSFTNDLEAIAHVMTALGRFYGLDAASAMAQTRLEMEKAQGDVKPDDRPIIIDVRPEKSDADVE